MGNERLDRLITQISRRYATTTTTDLLPSDAASIRIGTELGHLFLIMGKDKVQQENVLQLLCRNDIHPSIASAFFQVLEQRIQKDDFIEGSYLTEWMLTMEQQQQQQELHTIVLSSCIRAYAVYLVHSYDVHDHETMHQNILSTWKRFQHGSTRWQTTREVILQALRYPTNHGIAILAPILSLTLLATGATNPENQLEHTRFLSFLQRQIWNVWNTDGIDKESWLRFMIASFDIYSLMSCNNHMTNSFNEMVQDWFIDIIELLMMTSMKNGNNAKPKNNYVERYSRTVLQQLLPRSLQQCSTLESISILEAAGSLLTASSSKQSYDSALMVLRLSTECLITHDPRQRMILLEILQECNTVLYPQLLHSVASILIHEESCRETALALQNSVTSKKAAPSTIVGTLNMSSELFDLNVDISPILVDMILSTNGLEGTKFSPRQQIAALLWGVALLDDEDWFQRALRFLRSLVIAYSHLSIPLLAIIHERLNQVSRACDGSAVLQYLEFMAETLVLNANCAQEVWNLFVQWLNAHSPLTLRVALIRLFPKLIAGNKRLYRRVVDALGICSGSNEVGIKLAAAATLADMAEQDLIRDVSDVISWIQGFLTEGFETPVHSLLVHYALLSLHYLVLAEELDFDVVIKVLNKKMCPITDHDALLKLPFVVIEALVLLLGDGESRAEEDEEDEGGGESGVSLQVNASVDALIAIGEAMTKDAGNFGDSVQAVERIRRTVFFSLSKYSAEGLGVDEELVKNSVTTDENMSETVDSQTEIRNRYTILRQLVVAGATYLPEHVSLDDKERDTGITDLAAKLIQLEENSLGPSLWQKRGSQLSQKSKTTATDTKMASKGSFDLESTLSTISASLQTTQECAKSPVVAKSIAALLSATGEDLLSVLRENADPSIDTTDPLLFIFAVHGYLHIAQKIASKTPLTIKKISEEFQSWSDTFISFDAMCLALACFCVYNSFDSEGNDANELKEVYDMILKAYKNHEFEKENVAPFCLGILGIFCLRVLSIEQVMEIIDLLEQSAKGYGRQNTFAPFYAISMIANACSLHLRPGSGNKIDQSDIKKLIYRTVGIILREIVNCFDNSCESISKLASSMINGEGVVSSSLIDTVLKLEPNSVALLATKKVDARYLFLSCAVCFPALADVNSYLLLALFRFLESLEWGSEKGIAIPSVILACQKSGVMKKVLLEQIFSAYTSEFKKRKIKNDACLRDVYFALKATDWTLLVDKQDDCRLPSLSKKRLDDEAAALALVASVMSIASLSCFGTSSFQRLFHLRYIDNDDCITKVVDNIFKAVSLKDGSYNCGIGIILMGLLSSMTEPQEDDDEDGQTIRSVEDEATLPQNAENDIVSHIDFTKIAIPLDGTVVAGLRNALEHCFTVSSDTKARDLVVKNFLESLVLISVPETYAAFFLEHLLREGIEQEAALSFLSTQVSKRRRAFSSGQSFIQLASKIYQTETEQWYGYLASGNTKLLYMQIFSDSVPKLPDIIVDECFYKLWKLCASKNENQSEMIMIFLANIDKLLRNTAVSPKLSSSLQRFTFSSLFAQISNLKFDVISKQSEQKESIIQLFARCISVLPVSILDEKKFLLLNDSLDCFQVESTRALLKLELIKMNYFERNNKTGPDELATITSWLSKMVLSSNEKVVHFLRRIVCAFASTVQNDPSIVKRDVLASILEVLLLAETKRCRIALEWLAVVLASWQKGIETNCDFSLSYLCTVELCNFQTLASLELEQVFDLMIDDLPSNLAIFSRNENLSAVVSNILHRLLRRWSKHSIDKNSLDIVQRAAICCQVSATSEAFVSMASSVLVRSNSQF